MRFWPLPVLQDSSCCFPIHHEGVSVHLDINRGKRDDSKSESEILLVFGMQPFEKRPPFHGLPLVWCSSVHHVGLSIRRPGFKSRHEHQNRLIDALQS